jgi:hypothetical protein
MKKVTTSTGRTIYVSTKGLETAEPFKANNEKNEFWIRLNYGKFDNVGQQSSTLVGPFQSIEQAENVIQTLY